MLIDGVYTTSFRQHHLNRLDQTIDCVSSLGIAFGITNHDLTDLVLSDHPCNGEIQVTVVR